jgi:viroplasmin and RNaseH domain-containing protein
MMNEPKHYVVFIGRKTGIFFDAWKNVEQHITQFSNNDHKGFKNEESARIAYGLYKGFNTKIKTVKIYLNNEFHDFKDEKSARIAYGIYRGLNARIRKG